MSIPPAETQTHEASEAEDPTAFWIRLSCVLQGGLPHEHTWQLPNGSELRIGRDSDGTEVCLADGQASRVHARVTVDDCGRVGVHDENSRNGTFLNGSSIESTTIEAPSSVLRLGQSLFVLRRCEAPPLVPRELLIPEGCAPARAVAEYQADRVAPTDLPVILFGPTGSGKERLARRIHEQSGRKGTFVPVNCATLSKDLVGSELFGHTAGAFSGAAGARLGLFREAHGGTLFLDEIAELPLDQQAALLRVLEERTVRPVGSDREILIDVRVLAATHEDLVVRKQSGVFRPDLYARLAGFTLHIPGLESRIEEILPLFHDFLGEAPKWDAEAAERMLLHPWPENIRELKHLARQIQLFRTPGEPITLQNLPSPIRTHRTLRTSPILPKDPSQRDGPPQSDELIQMLRDAEGNVAEVARRLGTHRQQVYRWIQKHQIDMDSFRRSDDTT